jgi:hypothetical protein
MKTLETINIPDFFSLLNDLLRSSHCSIGIGTGYGLDGLSSVPVIATFFSSPQRSDWP